MLSADFAAKAEIVLGARADFVEVHDGLADLGGLGELDVLTDHGTEQLALKLLHVLGALDDLTRNFGAMVVHGDHHSGDVEAWVELFLNELDGLHEKVESVEGEGMRLEGDEHLGAGVESIYGEESERRGGVNENEVIVRAQDLHSLLQLVLSTYLVGSPALELGEFDGAWCDVEIRVGSLKDDVLHDLRLGLHEHVERALLNVVECYAQSRGGIALGVEVDDQHPLAHGREPC